jgi:DedD protein
VNDVLKQRLVGALILLALGVVFWPIVFVQPEESSNVGQRSIPQPPAVSTSPIEEPDPAGLRASLERATGEDLLTMDGTDVYDDSERSTPRVPATDITATDITATDIADTPEQSMTMSGQEPAVSEVRTEAPQRLAVDGDGVPVAWTLQVVTVSSYEKAESLRQRLLQKSEKAYVTTVSSGGKQLYRVSVGPKFERHELERIQASINAEFGVKTMLVRYTP